MIRPPASRFASRPALLAAAVALLALLVLVPAAPAKLLRGTSSGDTIVGSKRADRIEGRAGPDRIAARGGADVVHGGPGDDRIAGNGGPDVLRGGSGRDRLRGGAGDDLLVGGSGRDQLQGGAGNDHLRADAGVRDVVSCGAGWDVVEVDRFDVVRDDCEVPKRLSLAITGSGTGVVRETLGTGTCPPACVGDRRFGTVVELVAEPDPSSVFAGWSGACETAEATCRVELRDDAALTARFVLRQVSVAVSSSGGGAITSSPALLDCGATCTATVGWGTTIALTARPAPGFAFASWSGACAGQATWACVVEARGAVVVAAAFAPTVSPAPASHRVDVSTSAGGRVSSAPAGIDCTGPASCGADFPAGGEVLLVPEPAAGHRFAGWTGLCAPAADACRVAALGGPLTLLARFEPIPPPRLRIVVEGSTPPWWLLADDRSPNAILCPLVCEADYELGATVRLTWSSPWRVVIEEGCTAHRLGGTLGYCDVGLDGDVTVRLRFARGPAG